MALAYTRSHTHKKKCINCGENHSTLAMKCSIRKKIPKKKRAQENDRGKITYSSITQSSLPPKTPFYNLPVISKGELKINICTAHAQNKNQQKPGTYATQFNKTLKANNPPNIIIPEDTDTNISNLSHEQDVGTTGLVPSVSEPVTR